MSEETSSDLKRTNEEGYEIPVSRRSEFLRDLQKVAPKVEPESAHTPDL